MFLHKNFTEATDLEKVDFFVHCQKLLIKFHPQSPFLCRRDNIKQRIQHILNFFNNYKGLCLWDENVCVLYNKIVVTDDKDPVYALRTNMFKPADPNYNAITIDFVVFRTMEDCKNIVPSVYEPRLQYAIFVKNNKVKIYPIAGFLTQVFGMQII